VRGRILSAWIDTRHERPDHLTIELPAQERERRSSDELVELVRNDLRAACAESRTLRFFTRSERREATIAFAFLVVCLLLSTGIEQLTDNDALFHAVSQGLVVLGWVAMWQPAQVFFAGATRRLSHGRYVEVAAVPIEIVWR